VTTTTATTGPPPILADAVRGRIVELTARGADVFTVADFRGVAQRAGQPDSWLGDHLLVLEGIGVLQSIRRPGPRSWIVNPGSEYLR
jgi:hypothetical protein